MKCRGWHVPGRYLTRSVGGAETEGEEEAGGWGGGEWMGERDGRGGAAGASVLIPLLLPALCSDSLRPTKISTVQAAATHGCDVRQLH